jgi:hypothetical protein
MPENLATEAFEKWLAQSDAVGRDRVLTYRDFYSGEHDIALTDRQQSRLNITTAQIRSLANVCPMVVDTVAERLSVRSFIAADQRTADKLAEWWHGGDLDAHQDDVHLSALRDGDGYMLVEWNPDTAAPSFYHELADDGTNGVGLVYSSERRKTLYGYKRWRVEEGEDAGNTRLNLYFPDRVEKYITGHAGAWTLVEAPLPWVDGAGQPLGIPLIHFPTNPNGNDYGTSELESVIPLQRVLTSLWVDLIAAADATGFQLRTLTGDIPAEEMIGSPGAIWYSENPAAAFGTLPPGDLSLLIEAIRHTTMTIAQVSRVPLTMFQDSKAVSSAETIVASERGLIAKVNDRSKSYGLAWRAAMRMAVTLHNAFGPRPEVNGDGIEPVWASFEQVDSMALATNMGNLATLHINNGAPLDAAYELAGYTPEQVERIMRTDFVGMAQ